MSEQQNIRIRLQAYDHKLLEKWTGAIIDTSRRTGARIVGPIPLPNHKIRYTVNRSPHIDKKSREQFEIRIHKRCMDISCTSLTIEALNKLDLPPGVHIEIEVH